MQELWGVRLPCGDPFVLRNLVPIIEKMKDDLMQPDSHHIETQNGSECCVCRM